MTFQFTCLHKLLNDDIKLINKLCCHTTKMQDVVLRYTEKENYNNSCHNKYETLLL